jgi:hypothetical protein
LLKSAKNQSYSVLGKSLESKSKTARGRTEYSKAPINPITLSYTSADLQREFRGEHTRRSIKLVRLSLLLAAVLYSLFGFLDQYFVPEQAGTVFMIRISVSIYLICVMIFTYTDFVKRYFQPTMILVVVIGSGGIIAMIAVTETVGGYNYYAGLILAFIFAHSLLRLRFIYASITTWCIFIAYEFVAISLKLTPQDILLNNTFFLFSANVLGMFSSYGLEYYMRATFWQSKKVEEEQRKLLIEHDRKTKELEAARRIQIAMLPKGVPAHPTLDICVSMKTALEIGGDYYDFSVREDNTITFAIGDATGHGAQAGVMVTATKMLFSNFAEREDIVEIMQRASRSIKRMGMPKLYMAMAIGRIRDTRLQLVGAGIPPALVYRSSDATIEKVPLKGVPLGSFVDFPYRKKEISLQPGDTVLFMTDGFPELFDGDGEMVGYDRAISVFREIADQSPPDIVKRLNAFTHQWLNGAMQQDDTTFIVMKVRTPDDSYTVDNEVSTV